MTNQTIYTVGGTVQAGGGIYIPRKADDELLQYCRASEFAFILSSRQVGKSSLMVRTARQLEQEGVRSVIIDLSSIGVKISADEWYLGILDEIATTLNLKADIFAWWSERAGLGQAQRMTNFFRDVLLKEISEPVVLFFDEIDSTLSIPFADDFFAALRSIYNARSTVADFKRLSFVMIGVATPGDLIADSKRTPFNIGRRVDLTDFTPAEATPLAGELGAEVLGWVFNWTGGHPYLTQRLCAHLSKLAQGGVPAAEDGDGSGVVTEESVADSVKQLFEGEQGKQDNNLQFVRDMLTKRAPDIQRVLKTYKDIRAGKKVSDDERSIPKAHLKISGVVRRENGNLLPRNRIYERAFDLQWVKENTPPTTTRRLALALSFVTVFALMVIGYFVWQEWNRTDRERADRFNNAFLIATPSAQRLENLAGLFRLQGAEFTTRAFSLFNSLQPEQQLELFTPTTSSSLKKNQLTVALNVYQSFGFKTEADEQGDKLLAKIRDALSGDDDAPEAERKLKNEITLWLEGRKLMQTGKYAEAKTKLRDASLENPQNPALYYDLARAYAEMKNYSLTLEQLELMLKYAPSRNTLARLMIEKNDALSQYWSDYGNADNYPNLANTIITSVAFVDEKNISMVLIPAGIFIMGSDTSDNRDEKPAHSVDLPDYYMDKYEVTNAAYKLCVDAGICQPPVDTSSATRASYYGNSLFDNYPVINVDWNMSKTYCGTWRGAKLPSEAEWEKAARGTDGRTYPWGENIDCTYANYSGDPKGDCVGDTTAVGSYASGQSPYGVYDMAGNVWEWTSNIYQPYPYVATDGRENMTSLDSRVLRGGSWGNSNYGTRSSFRDDLTPDIIYYFYFGFRCARSLP